MDTKGVNFMYYLQNRWKMENNYLIYYGLRNKSNMFKNKKKLSKKQQAIVNALPCELTKEQLKTVSSFLGRQIVTKEELQKTPRSLEEAKFCVSCIANDFIIPGLEFDESGKCPMKRQV